MPQTRFTPRSVHPVLVVFPIVLLAASVMFDLIGFTTGSPVWTTLAVWNIAFGVGLGVVASIFGILDYRAIPLGTRASRVGLVHALMNVMVLALFATSFLVRALNSSETVRLWALSASSVGLVLMLGAASLGSELLQVGARIRDPDHPLRWPPS
jgi:uncharacterized membrane protein